MGEIVRASVLAFVLLAWAGAPLASSSGIVPERFRGVWASSPRSCASDDDLKIRLDAGHVSFWESSGPIRSVVAQSDEIAITAELSGEGQTWLWASTFRLSTDGLTPVGPTSGVGAEVVRYRCPGPVDPRPNISLKRTNQSLRD
jgi:hypothetical protein